jgi:hypothetical protein
MGSVHAESYQNYQNWAVSNQRTTLGEGGECVGGIVNLLMFDRGGVL